MTFEQLLLVVNNFGDIERVALLKENVYYRNIKSLEILLYIIMLAT